jgi:hypothetical protein
MPQVKMSAEARTVERLEELRRLGERLITEALSKRPSGSGEDSRRTIF